MSLLMKTPVLPTRTAFPLNPYGGMKFIHDTTLRKIEYVYDDATGNWVALRSIGTIQMYVDGTLGTNDLDHGIGPGANAFATIQYAWDALPLSIDTTATIGTGVYHAHIYVAGGTYNEDLVLRRPLDGARVQISGGQGLTSVASLVATGGAQGAGANCPNITGVFAPGAYDNYLCYFTSGANNGTAVISSLTTAGVIYLPANPLPAVPVNGDTYEIYNWGVIINGTIDLSYCSMVDFVYIRFNVGAGAYGIQSWGHGTNLFLGCYIYNNNLATFTIIDSDNSMAQYHNCLLEIVGPRYGYSSENLGNFELRGGKIIGDGVNSVIGLWCHNVSDVSNICGIEITDVLYGIYGSHNSQVITNADGSGCDIWIHGCPTQGAHMDHGAQLYRRADITYGTDLSGGADANGADEGVDAGSYGHIS